MAEARLCLLITFSSILSCVLVYGDMQLNRTVEVGERVFFHCDLKELNDTKELVDWTINQTEYNFNRLPYDYTISQKDEVLTFIIEEAKLWMNNTIYSCYAVGIGIKHDMALLYVKFDDFEGPEDEKPKIGENVFISCRSPIITKNNLSVVWNIDGILYNPTRLPSKYLEKEDGLFIANVTRNLHDTTFQCLFRSNNLWRNDFYYSDTARLTVLANNLSKIHHEDLAMTLQFTFNHQGFFFGDNFTIAWKDATNCQQPNYYLVKSYENMQDNTTNLGTRKNVTLTREELIVNNDNNYRMYIRASSDGAQNCGESATYITINPAVPTTVEYVNPGSPKCFNNLGVRVIWPNSVAGQGEDCICDDLKSIATCSCVNNTEYSVDGDGKGLVCWRNLDESKNGTKIFFVQETRYILQSDVPRELRWYVLSYEIIITEPPGKPNIFEFRLNDARNLVLGIQDVYSGHSDIKKYHVNITDITKNNYSIESMKEVTGNKIITTSDEVNDIVSPVCGPQKISVTTENDVGHSLPTEVMLPSNGQYDICDCIMKTVLVDLTQINDSSRNDIHLHVSCDTQYNNLETIALKLILEPSDVLPKNANCSQDIHFNDLSHDVSYEVTVQWKDCAYGKKYGPFWSEKNQFPLSDAILGGVIGCGTVLILAILTAVVILCIYCLRRPRSVLGETQNPQNKPNN